MDEMLIKDISILIELIHSYYILDKMPQDKFLRVTGMSEEVFRYGLHIYENENDGKY